MLVAGGSGSLDLVLADLDLDLDKLSGSGSLAGGSWPAGWRKLDLVS